ALTRLANKAPMRRFRFDENDTARIKLQPLSFGDVVNASFDQIRQYGRTHTVIAVRLLEILREIVLHVKDKNQFDALMRQAEMIKTVSMESIFEQNDRKSIQDRYEAIKRVST